MSNQDYLILLVGLGVIAWIFRRPLTRLWTFLTAASHDESRIRVWRVWILLGAVFVPPVGIAICNFLTRNSLTFSNTFQSLIVWTPGLAWIVYAAWISKRKNRWIGIAKWGLIVLFARALTILAACLTPSGFPPDFFWQFQGFQLKSEVVHLFGALIFLMIGGRIFRLHLVQVRETELEPPRITIPFLMLTQALLAIATSLMAWVAKSNMEAINQPSATIQILMTFCFCLSTALLCLAIFMPSRIPRWALVTILIIGAAALRMLVLILWAREMRSADDPQTVQMADQFLHMISWQMALQTVLLLGVFVLIRVLFRKVGLVIVRAGFPTQISRSIYR